MLFKPDEAGAVKRVRSSLGRRLVSITITLLILGGLGAIGWNVLQQRHERQGGGRNGGGRPDMAVPVLAAMPVVKDVPVYLDGVGAVRALNTVTVRSQVDGKLIAVNFVEGQDVRKGDVLAEIDPAIYQAQYDQAVAKKAQDEALLTNQKIDLQRYEQLAASNAGSKQQADTQRATVAQQQALIRADQAAIDNAQATLSYTRIVAPLSGRAGLRQLDQGNIIHTSDATGLVIITQLQPVAVQFSLPQQQIMRVNAAAAKGTLAVDVFGNDGMTVVDIGTLKGIDNQVDPTTGTLKLKGEFPNDKLQLWPGQFVNVRLKVETLSEAIVVPTSAVQRGPVGTFSYVIGEGNVVTARPVTVMQQNETEAVIASGLTASDQVVTTGFANLTDGAKVIIGHDEQTPQLDLAPRRRGRNSQNRDQKDQPAGEHAKEPAKELANQPAKDGQPQAEDGQGQRGERRQWQGKDGEHRRQRREGGEDGQGAPAGSVPDRQPSGGARPQP
jgi:multidrug efflux system membrane fusion protein